MRVLLTGSAGFIGSAVGRALGAAGHEVVPVDAMLDLAHGATAPPPAPTRSTSGTPPAGLICFAAWTSCATRRPSSAPACEWPTSRRTPATTTSGPPPCSPPCTRPACRRWCWLRRWSSTARVATHARSTAGSCPGPGRGRRWRPATSRTTARYAAAPSAGRRSTRTAGWTAQLVRRQQSGAGALHVGVGAAGRCRRRGPALPQRLRARHAAEHAVRRVAAMFRSSLERGEPPQVFEDGGQVRDFVHVDDVARANLLADRGRDRSGRRELGRRTTSRPGNPIGILEVAELVARGTGRDPARGHRRVPDRRRPAHRRLARARAQRARVHGRGAAAGGPGRLRDRSAPRVS